MEVLSFAVSCSSLPNQGIHSLELREADTGDLGLREAGRTGGQEPGDTGEFPRQLCRERSRSGYEDPGKRTGEEGVSQSATDPRVTEDGQGSSEVLGNVRAGGSCFETTF